MVQICILFYFNSLLYLIWNLLGFVCQVKGSETTEASKNLVILAIPTDQAPTPTPVLSFTQKVTTGAWNVKWTQNESHCARIVTNELHCFDSLNFNQRRNFYLMQ